MKRLFYFAAFLLLGLFFDQMEPAYAQGTWSERAPMPTPRGPAVAAVNGIIYAIGGVTTNGAPLSVVEAYDPASDTWSSKASLPYPIERAAAGAVNGIIYLVGGCADNACGALLSTVFAYDPATDTWAQKASIPTPRRDFAVGVVNGILYALGGNQGPGYICLSSVEAYDPAADSWSEKAALPIGRVTLAAAVVNGTLYAIGGDSCNPVPNPGYLSDSSELDAYDPVGNSWTTKAPMPTAGGPSAGGISGMIYAVGEGATPTLNQAYNALADTWGTAAPMPTGRNVPGVAVVNGALYAIGGFSTGPLGTNEAFMPASTWTLTGNLNTSRVGATTTLLVDGRVLVAGGQTCSNGSCTDLNSAEVYDPVAGTWTLTTNMAASRISAAAVRLTDGRVLVTGGAHPAPATNITEIYDPVAGTWTQTGNMNQSRGNHLAVLLASGKVLAAGGYSGGYLSSAEVYDPTSGTWSFTGSLPVGVANPAASLLPNGGVLVAGGSSGCEVSAAELYDPTFGTWSQTGTLNQDRAWNGSAINPLEQAVLIGTGQVLVAGGVVGCGGVFTGSAELYNPASGSWTATGSLSLPEDQGQLVLLDNGQVLITGGVTNSNSILNTAQIFDAGSGTWSATSAMNQARAQHGATLLMDGRVLVAGGYALSNGSESSLRSAEIYGPVAASSHVTTTAVSSSQNPSVYGQPVTLTVTVTPIAGSTMPTGTVTFSDGTNSLGTAALSAGQASLTISSLSVGSHPIVVTYSGDSNFSGSTSPALTQVVNQASTSTSISSSPNPAVTGQPVTFTAAVNPVLPGVGTPTGTVTFTDGATTLGSAPLSSGQATLTVPSLSPGSHSIAGQYSGDINFGSSSSAGGGGGGFTQTVNTASTTTTVNSSVNASILNQPVTFTAYVSVVAPGSGTPMGSVTFHDGSSVLGTVALGASGSATFTTSSLGVNGHSITAAYGGDTSFNASASAAFVQRVQYEPAGTTCYGNAGHQILPPINSDGSSVFKQGRKIPAAFRVCDANGISVGAPGVVSSFFLTAIITGTATTTVQDVVDTNNPDTAFRWDATNQQWIFNITTQNLASGSTYVYTISLNDGASIIFQYGLK